MKKTRIIALFLCLVVVAFSFAACGKKNNTASTTAKPATAAGTTAEATTAGTTAAPATTVAHVHTPEDHPTIDLKPTCSTEGEQQVYCAECGDPIPGTFEKIPVDPTAHKIEDYVIVEPTLLNPTGTKTGTCVLCDTEVVEPLTHKTYAIASAWDTTARADFNQANGVNWALPSYSDFTTSIYIQKSINDIKGADRHYYPTEAEPLGNDLLVEVSYLWTEADKNTFSWECMTFGHVDGYDVFNCGANVTAKIRGGYTYEYTYKKDGLEAQPLGEYGWHRLGFRVHQDAAIVADEVKYTYLASAYVDGTLIYTVDMTDYVVRRNPTSSVTALLYTAEIEDGDLVYYDIGANDKSSYEKSFALLFFEGFFDKAGGYCIFCDLNMTCGSDFVQNVEANADPADGTYTFDNMTEDDTADDVDFSAKIWYKAVTE